MTALTESLEQTVNIFPRRFFFNALLPTLVLVSATSSAIALMLFTPRELSGAWNSSDASTKVVAGLGYLAVVWFIASLVASQWRAIVRLYEGYPLQTLMERFNRRAV